jgi:hypothetical protein
LGIDHRDGGAREAIGAAIGQIRPGFAFGALAAGADIIAAQALLAANAELHLVLPSDPSDFCQSSVAPFGADWVADFDTIMASAHSVTICGDSSGTSGAGVALAEYHAMGLAVEKAGQLQTQAIALRIEPAGRPTLGDPWRSSGRPYRHVALSAKHDQISAPLPEGRLQFDVAVEGSGTSSYPTLNEAQLAVRGSISARVAIDCHTGNGNRVVAFLGKGESGMLVASRDAALALLASGMTERIETLGEMATTGGALEICLVTLPPMQD